MTMNAGPRSFVRGHPFLAVYLAALAVVWAVTVATWTIGSGGPPSLHPVAQGLQYLLVVLAATLGALRLYVEGGETRADAEFGFYDLRWSISDDVGGQAFWTALWIGAAAMVVNMALLVVADLLAGGAAGPGTYAEWIGSGLAAGAVVGMFSALIAVGLGAILRRRRA